MEISDDDDDDSGCSCHDDNTTLRTHPCVQSMAWKRMTSFLSTSEDLRSRQIQT
jgi:hypothetical protein